MAERRTVSIVLTTFNHARFLGDALASVAAQTVAAYEVIVVDDGSTDDPASVVKAWPSVQLIRQTNQGLSAARNVGWRAATGDFVVFLDADDLLRPNALAVNIQRFECVPESAFVYAGHEVIDEYGAHLRTGFAHGDGSDAYERFLRGNAVGMHATVMYRRDRIAEAGGFDTSLVAAEDYELLLRLSRRFKVGFSPDIIAEYRRHGENMSSDVTRMLRASLRVLREQKSFAQQERRWQSALAAGFLDMREFYARQALLRLYSDIRQRRLVPRGMLASAYVAMAAPHACLSLVARSLRDRLLRSRAVPAIGRVGFGDLRRTSPICRDFGFSRGRPIDRRYIESFLHRHADDIRGRVLEIADNSYTRQFGGTRVLSSDILHVDVDHAAATLIGDLASDMRLPSEAFDCIILTQTLHLIFDVHGAIATLHRMLKPGGVLLMTVPGVSSVDRGEWGGTWFWSFTPAALERLLGEQFTRESVAVSDYGNVLAASAFLYGLADVELDSVELDSRDSKYPVIVTARAVRATTA